jgi:hypothetical protein
MNNITRFTRHHSPEILSGLAAAGVVTTAVLTYKAAVKAGHRQASKLQEGDPEETPRQRFEAEWRLFVPAGISGAITVGCIIAAARIGTRRNTALVAGMALADRAFNDYKDEVREIIGERKELAVREKTAQKAIDENPPSSQVVIVSGDDQLCYDTFTDRYFRSEAEKIRKAENEVNKKIIQDMYCSLNEFYSLIGLDDCRAGEELGWNMDHLVDLVFSSHLTRDGTPCLAIGYKYLPFSDYGKMF